MRQLLLLPLLFAVQLSFAQYGNHKKQITLEDVYQNGTFRVSNVPGFNTLKDGRHYTELDNNQISEYNLVDGNKTQTIFSTDKKLNVDDYAFSEDERKILLFTESQNIYRHSVLHRVFIYDRDKKTMTSLDTGKVLHASFSPDGTKVAFVKNNNLYISDLKTNRTVAVTKDGVRNRIINGNCDWVYEEEFSFTQAYEWSKDGRYIAFYRFDESKVPEYTMTVYDSLYPTPYKYKYPKAGDINSVVQIKFYDLKTNRTINADLGRETDQYIPRIKWTAETNKLCIFRMNRRQNHMEYLFTDAATGKSKVMFTEHNQDYIEVDDNLHFLKDGSSFVFTSERDGWNHLYCYNYETQTLRLLTEGRFDVEGVTGIDDYPSTVFYTAAAVTPTQRELYSVSTDGGTPKKITQDAGMHEITPCTGMHYFLDKYSTLTTPPVYTLIDADGHSVRVLEDNTALKNTMAKYDLGQTVFAQQQGSDPTLTYNSWVIYPPRFDSKKKYPVLMFQYSGPGSQQVLDQMPGYYFWHQMLAEKGYIIVCTDVIGTGMRGEKFRKKTYLQLGKYESEEQIEVARNIAQLPYVDKHRIGIWGWSYGAFMSSTCLFKGNDVFKAAVAVAPVTNWRYYDNIYTERYMRTPQENPKGYDDNAPEMMANRLKGRFLLIHGTGDDNVHFQNSVSLVNNLIKANKDFDSEYYPNRAHGISGGNTRLHLFRRMTSFILENL